jgi:hypothetical protein
MRETIPLKGGQATQDRRLDRVPQYDPRNEQYPIRPKLTAVAPVPKTWAVGTQIDQGSEGACVGFGWTQELMSSPARVHIGPKWAKPAFKEDPNDFAREIYHRAQQLDEWPGADYSGTSVLAGAKACQEKGLIGEYRWAQDMSDFRDAIIQTGPIVIGIDWYESMYETLPSGLVTVSGAKVGGHCILVYGYHPHYNIDGKDRELYKWKNSWGLTYGKNGMGYVEADVLKQLVFDAHSDAAVPVTRYTKPHKT